MAVTLEKGARASSGTGGVDGGGEHDSAAWETPGEAAEPLHPLPGHDNLVSRAAASRAIRDERGRIATRLERAIWADDRATALLALLADLRRP